MSRALKLLKIIGSAEIPRRMARLIIDIILFPQTVGHRFPCSLSVRVIYLLPCVLLESSFLKSKLQIQTSNTTKTPIFAGLLHMFQNRFQDFSNIQKTNVNVILSSTYVCTVKCLYMPGKCMNLIGQIPEILPNYCKEDHEHLSKIFKNNVVGV